jgi:hypothetical protein
MLHSRKHDHSERVHPRAHVAFKGYPAHRAPKHGRARLQEGGAGGRARVQPVEEPDQPDGGGLAEGRGREGGEEGGGELRGERTEFGGQVGDGRKLGLACGVVVSARGK